MRCELARTFLADVFDECIDLVVLDGWTVDECIGHWPEHGDDLRSLLTTATQLASLPSIALLAGPCSAWSRAALRLRLPAPRS
jgi:hypothetical protein